MGLMKPVPSTPSPRHHFYTAPHVREQHETSEKGKETQSRRLENRLTNVEGWYGLPVPLSQKHFDCQMSKDGMGSQYPCPDNI